MSASNTPLRSDVGAPQSSLDDPASHHANSGSSSKNPNGEHSLGGFQAQNKMAVQPPREDDLQQSYATVVRTDADHKGWYGGMSKSHMPFLILHPFRWLFARFSAMRRRRTIADLCASA
jgi:hypothetical protein